MTGLIEKLEGAEAGSRALDGEICAVLGEQPEWATKHHAPRQPELWSDGKPGTWAREWLCPRYTLSLDAALALAERLLPDAEVIAISRTKTGGWGAGINGYVAHAASGPIALCAAILRARQSNGDPS